MTKNVIEGSFILLFSYLSQYLKNRPKATYIRDKVWPSETLRKIAAVEDMYQAVSKVSEYLPQKCNSDESRCKINGKPMHLRRHNKDG